MDADYFLDWPSSVYVWFEVGWLNLVVAANFLDNVWGRRQCNWLLASTTFEVLVVWLVALLYWMGD